MSNANCVGTPHGQSTPALPDLAEVNAAELWLAHFRRLCDSGLSMHEARLLGDERTRPSIEAQAAA